MRIAVVGLGKLGCPLAALMAVAGHDVTGADLNPIHVELVNKGLAPIRETGLDELMTKAHSRLRATTSVEEAAECSDIAFCIVPTPSNSDGSFDTAAAERVFEAIGRGWRRHGCSGQIAVLTSTVLPGDTDTKIKPALERGAGCVVGESLGLCYSPEFIALGSVIENMSRPDMILMGSSGSWAADAAIAVIKSFAEQNAPVARMSIIDAELTKIAVNTFVTTKISFANLIGEICTELPGADAAVVTAALGMDSRIGARYLQPAAPYGGPCFPRDNAAFIALCHSVGVEAELPAATDIINRRQVPKLVDQITSKVNTNTRIAVLGLSYKINTPVADEAFGVLVANALFEAGYEVLAYDPEAMQMAKRALNPGIALAAGIDHAIRNARVVVIATPWPEFESIKVPSSVAIIFDYWRVIRRSALGQATVLVNNGVGPALEQARPETIK